MKHDNELIGKIETAIGEVSIVALEDWAMMLAEEATDLPEDLTSEWGGYQFKMTFSGPFVGKLTGICSGEFAQTLCRNLLGLDSRMEPQEVDCVDSLKEMANVLTGNFVTTAFGTDVIFDLVLPEVTRVGSDDVMAFCESEGVKFYMGDDCGVALKVDL